MDDPGALGAICSDSKACQFLVWAPACRRVEVLIEGPVTRSSALAPLERGYHGGAVSDVVPGDRYRFRLDGQAVRADPASRWQPEGVHGPSTVVDSTFTWSDGFWKGLLLEDYVLYELHVGTYTAEGTLSALETHFPSLRELGVTAIELMPVAQFPGARNWGYDGVFPFAVHNSYGAPRDLKHLVNAAHHANLAVVLDVVYNHLGPEGNYLREFGPYFTSRHRTPWGDALNFDGPGSDEVRRYFVESALRWVDEFHVDALRLDAIHAIVDTSAYPFVEQLVDAVHQRAKALGRRIQVIAETDANDPRVCRPGRSGGLGCDAHWSDDLHHALHAWLTGERRGYYADFGSLEQVVAGLRDGYVYQGQGSAFRQRRHGRRPEGLDPRQLVVCAQNHDQVGNRMMGDRLATLVSFESMKLAAGAVLLSPFTPLLFMGEEYGETAPFQYFVDHSDAGLIEAVRRGRREEFASFDWPGEPPDPLSEATFARCRLNHALATSGGHSALRDYYRALLQIRGLTVGYPGSLGESGAIPGRGRSPDDAEPSTDADQAVRVQGPSVSVVPDTAVVSVDWTGAGRRITVLLNFAEASASTASAVGGRNGKVLLNSADERWAGPGEGEQVGRIRTDRPVRLAPRSVLVIAGEDAA